MTITHSTLYDYFITLQWRHNGHDGVSNHQLHDCLLNRLFRRRSKKTSNQSIWWRHHEFLDWHIPVKPADNMEGQLLWSSCCCYCNFVMAYSRIPKALWYVVDLLREYLTFVHACYRYSHFEFLQEGHNVILSTYCWQKSVHNAQGPVSI